MLKESLKQQLLVCCVQWRHPVCEHINICLVSHDACNFCDICKITSRNSGVGRRGERRRGERGERWSGGGRKERETERKE